MEIGKKWELGISDKSHLAFPRYSKVPEPPIAAIYQALTVFFQHRIYAFI